MAGLLPPIFVELKANASEFHAEMGKARAEIAHLETAGSAGFQKLAAVGKAALMGIASTAVTVGTEAVHMADKFELSHARLENAISKTGSTFEAWKSQIDGADKKLENLGFTNAESEQALGTLTAGLGSAGKALQVYGTAADLARFKNEDLNTASQAYIRALSGNARALKDLGITTAQYKLALTQVGGVQDLINSKIGGSAVAASETFSGKLETLRARTEDLGKDLGLILIPKIEDLVNATADAVHWLEKNKEIAEALGIAVGSVLTLAIGAYTVKLAQSVVASVAAAAAYLGVGAAAEATAVATTEAAGLTVAALGPIGLAIGGVALAGLELQKHWHSIWGWIEGDASDGASKTARNIVETFNSADPDVNHAGLALTTNLANGIAANGWQPIDAVTKIAKSVVGIAVTAAQTAINVMSSIPAWDPTNGGLPKQSLATILGGAQGDGANANPVPGVKGVGGSLAQLLGGTIKGKKYSQSVIDAAKNVNLQSGLNAAGTAYIGPYTPGGVVSPSLPPAGAGGAGGGGGSSAAAKAPKPLTPAQIAAAKFDTKMTTLETTIAAQAAFSPGSIHMAKVYEKEAEKTLHGAEANKKHAAALVKAAVGAKAKEAATKVLSRAQADVNKATKELLTLQKDEKTLLDAQKQAALDAAQAAAALANAKIEAGLDFSNAAAVAQAKVTEAENTLNADQAGSLQYYQDLAALHQAQVDLTNVIAQNTQATISNTTAMTQPLNQLPTYLANRATVNAGAYAGGMNVTVSSMSGQQLLTSINAELRRNGKPPLT